MVAAADELLAVLDDDGRTRISFDVGAVEWQTWANPEFMQFDTGLRLDLQPDVVREKALALPGVEPFDPGMGRPMKEWVVIPLAQSEVWPGYAAEALEYVRG